MKNNFLCYANLFLLNKKEILWQLLTYFYLFYLCLTCLICNYNSPDKNSHVYFRSQSCDEIKAFTTWTF